MEPPRRLPPLTALRAFEAAARHKSFTRAAEELSVTQGAVSRQIRVLEDFLGTALFLRLTRRVELTTEGQRYYETVWQAFDALHAATKALRGPQERSVIRLSVLPSISSFWLMPRLAAFSQGPDGAEIRVISSIDPVDLRGKEVDLAIRVGALPDEKFAPDCPRIDRDMVTDWHGVQADFLFADVLAPVCSPRLLSQDGPLHQLDDLARLRLIHVTTRQYAWTDWLRAHRARVDPDRSAIYFGHFFMALEAARAGRGVALVPTILVRHYEHAADLVSPFPADLRSAGNYRLLVHESRVGDPDVRRLRQWLLAEAAAERAAWPPALSFAA